MNELIDRIGLHFSTSGLHGVEAAMTAEVRISICDCFFVSSLKATTEAVVQGNDLRARSLNMAAAYAQVCRDAAWNVVYARALRIPVLAYAGTQHGWLDTTDNTCGPRMTFANYAVLHLRLSGNAPELRCYAGSKWVERATDLCRGCLGRVQQYIEATLMERYHHYNQINKLDLAI